MKLTEWYPAHIKPVHVGVYLTDAVSKTTNAFQYWNGEFWGMYAPTPKECSVDAYKGIRSSKQIVKWRDVAK